jgi:hypothetical protein
MRSARLAAGAGGLVAVSEERQIPFAAVAARRVKDLWLRNWPGFRVPPLLQAERGLACRVSLTIVYYYMLRLSTAKITK